MKKYLVIYEEGLVIRKWNPDSLQLKKKQFICTWAQATELQHKMQKNFPNNDYKIISYKRKIFEKLIPLFEN